jgi:hypothetical protein
VVCTVINGYAVVLSLPEYAQKIGPPQRFIMPAINPFSTTKKELSEAEIEDRLDHYGIPTNLPLVVQVSGFDKWKDPQESSKRSGFRSPPPKRTPVAKRAASSSP